MTVVVLDNYDSFTYNLVQYLGELGADPVVVRNDAATVDELLAQARDGKLIVSPGPCTPNEAGVSIEAIRHRELPVEGVQFHPESVLTGEGMAILRNFLAL